MTTEHTPGTWAYQPSQAEGHWIIGLHNDIPECIGLSDDGYMCVSGICSEADARLIAAAPDLLEALQSLLPMLDEWHDEFPDHVGDKEGPAIDAARAAIAKATGEQQ